MRSANSGVGFLRRLCFESLVAAGNAEKTMASTAMVRSRTGHAGWRSIAVAWASLGAWFLPAPTVAVATEGLGGFWIIEAADDGEALDWAVQGSQACGEEVEVRAFQSE